MRVNPTVLLFAALIVAFTTVLAVAVWWDQAPPPAIIAAFAVQALLFFPAYTVAHDAAHHIASRSHRLNEIMLVACGVIFLFEPYLFRRLHLTHHARTDEPDDPDLFSAGNSLLTRASRSALLLVGYYLYALRHWRHEAGWSRHVIAAPLIPLAIAGAFIVTGNGTIFLIAWLGPLLVSGGVMALLLSSLPHDAATRTTRNLAVPRPLQWLLGNGHLHLAHHTAPTVPWYRLPAFWRAREQSPSDVTSPGSATAVRPPTGRSRGRRSSCAFR